MIPAMAAILSSTKTLTSTGFSCLKKIPRTARTTKTIQRATIAIAKIDIIELLGYWLTSLYVLTISLGSISVQRSSVTLCI